MKNFIYLMPIIFILSACAGGSRKGNGLNNGGPVYYAVAVMNPTKDNVATGRVLFSEAFGKLKIQVIMKGLDKKSKHGIHIHEFGDCTAPNAISAGDHYNPEGSEHGSLEAEKHHIGDLGNMITDQNGNAILILEVPNMSINGAVHPVLGRGVIVHKDVDDLISQPTGGAGARIACGVIGAAAK